MRFHDFLRTTVLICATSATALAVATLAGVNGSGQSAVALVAAGWWLAAGLIGIWLGRGSAVSEQIGTLLANARIQTTLPEVVPARTLLNRLWPVLVVTVVAAGLAVIVPQVPAVAAGFAIIWALAWRHQASAVRAIEDRDGARFYVDRTSLLAPIRLVRTPGFRANLVELEGQSRRSADGRA